MSIHTLLAYSAVVSLIGASVLSIIQLTNIVPHLANLLRRGDDRFISFDDFVEWLDISHPRLSELLTCPICLGTWCCFTLSAALWASGHMSLAYVCPVTFTALAPCVALRGLIELIQLPDEPE
jgi:hypothetical protein